MDLPAAVAAPKTVGTVGKRKSAKKKSKKPIFYINLTHCKYDILRTCIEEKGWVECSDDDGVDWVIFWTDTSVSPQRVMLLEKYQKINHFPGMLSIARKAQLAINLRRLQAIFPKEYNFFPETWVLPQDTKEFRNQFSDKTGKSKFKSLNFDLDGGEIQVACFDWGKKFEKKHTDSLMISIKSNEFKKSAFK